MQKILSIILGLVLLGCSTVNKPQKPSATGKAGELLVIVSDSKWKGAAGNIIREAFAKPVQMLPQKEPMFDLIQMREEAFVKLFETHRNLLFVEFDSSLEKPKIEIRRDVWSYPQVVINVYTPDDSDLKKLIEKNQEQFADFYVANEHERLINAYNRIPNHRARNWVKENMQLKVSVPEGFFMAKQESDFVWIRQTGTRDDLELGLLISVRPYRDPEVDFNHQVIWERRDKMTKQHIPGTFPGTYMTTYPELSPVFEEINFNGNYAIKARGLWKVHNDFMGGPFLNITFVDEERGRLITLDGFVYAPDFEKRDYLRQVESLMHSVEIIPKGEINDQNKDDKTGEENKTIT